MAPLPRAMHVTCDGAGAPCRAAGPGTAPRRGSAGCTWCRRTAPGPPPPPSAPREGGPGLSRPRSPTPRRRLGPARACAAAAASSLRSAAASAPPRPAPPSANQRRAPNRPSNLAPAPPRRRPMGEPGSLARLPAGGSRLAGGSHWPAGARPLDAHWLQGREGAAGQRPGLFFRRGSAPA